MASIGVTVGPITATLNATDQAATTMIRAYCRANDMPDTVTDAQTPMWFLRHLIQHAKGVADDLEVGETARDAAKAARLARAGETFG